MIKKKKNMTYKERFVILVFVLFLCSPSFCSPVRRKRSPLGDIAVNLPFSDMLNLPDLSLDGGRPRKGNGLELNLPFSGFNVPDKALFEVNGFDGGNKELINPLQLPNGLYPDFESQLIPKTGKKENPFSVINMPLSKMAAPLAHISDQQGSLPPGATEKLQKFASPYSNGDLTPTSVLSAFGGQGGGDVDLSRLLSGAGSLLNKPGIGGPSDAGKTGPLPPTDGQNLPTSRFEGILNDGNLETAHISEGPIKHESLPLPNKLTLPLGIMEFPYSLMRMPLSNVKMPLADPLGNPGGSLPQPQIAAQAEEISKTFFKDDPVPGKKSTDKGGDPSKKEKVDYTEKGLQKFKEKLKKCGNDLVCQAKAVLVPPLAINLNSFSMPYSFLNNPLGFFNMPFAFFNLPYGSFNHPFAHLNTPFSFLNLPLHELLQTFGGVGIGRSSDEAPLQIPDFEYERELAKGLYGPMSDRQFVRMLSPIEDSLWFPDQNQTTDRIDSPGKNKTTEFLNFFGELNGNVNSGEFANDAKKSFSRPGDAIGLADQFVVAALDGNSNEGVESGVPQIQSEESALEQKRAKKFVDIMRSAVPAIPEMGGLFGTPFSTFPTPFSLFNLPFGFMDLPIGFLNLPLSHFNLPLSHMTLPFSKFNLPFKDTKLPEIEQTIDTATIELADIPPSLLQILNPDDPLSSYLNLPLSEMNLPFTVFDMPFSIFDLPFAYLNLPFSHLNDPLTHLHLPFEISTLPLANLKLPFEKLLG